MGWSAAWPVARWSVPDDVDVFNNLVAALAEREYLVPSGYLSDEYDRLEVIRGQPAAGGPTGPKTVAALQKTIAQQLSESNDWRWWDRTRVQLYELADLLGDAFSASAWTYDLTQSGSAWTPPWPDVFNELRLAINQMDTLRRMPSTTLVEQTDSVFRLTFGITDWPDDRADTFALFDGEDDEAGTGILCQVGLTALLLDSGADQQWFVDSRQVEITFNTATLSGYTVSAAWLEFETEASPGSTDYSGTFTAEVTNSEGTSRSTFASNDYDYRSVQLAASDINTSGDTVLTIRSQKADTDDRTNWSPPGPNYQSTYREGFHLGDTVRLIVEVDFEYGQ
ncbi:MAG: hypothetical protein JXL80_09995 [Planctomycetes bacterium]|nr:hypothetical protein [Planctomycetota bacterium]